MKMACSGCLTGTNGQSCHAPRFFKATCLLTLHRCIAFTHATVAPAQYWPFKGTTLLRGGRATCQHSEQITELARIRKSTQNTSQMHNTDMLSQLASESYCSQRERHSSGEISWEKLLATQACQYTDKLCLHPTDANSIAWLTPEPRRITDIGASLPVAEDDVHAFGQAIYQLSRPRQKLDNITAKLLRQLMPTQTFGLTNLTLATALSHQHNSTSGYPMQAALLNHQGWQQQLRITGSVQQPGIHGQHQRWQLICKSDAIS